jgi:hypothetical protein
MNRRRLHSSQVSARYYVPQDESQADKQDYSEHAYSSMLIDDVVVGVIPIGGRSDRQQFMARILPEDGQVERLISEAIGRGHERDLGPALCHFVGDCARTIMHYGQAVYEIVFLSDAAGGDPSTFALELIHPDTLIQTWRGIAQQIPQRIAAERGLPTRLELPMDRLIQIQPRVYKTGKVRHALRTLVVLSGRLLPEFAIQPQGSDQRMPFDFAEYERAQKVALAVAGRQIGWNARSSLQNEVLEYYWLDRHLRFVEFKTTLREEIIATLGEGLTRAGHRRGFDVRLEVDGLPSTEDVRRARGMLAAGQGTFKEIVESVGF